MTNMGKKGRITKLGQKAIQKANQLKEGFEDWEEGKFLEVQCRNYNYQVSKCDNPDVPDDRDEIRHRTLFFISDIRIQRELRSGDQQRIQKVYDSMPEDILDCYLHDETNGCRFCDIEKQGNKAKKREVYQDLKGILGYDQKPKKTRLQRLMGK